MSVERERGTACRVSSKMSSNETGLAGIVGCTSCRPSASPRSTGLNQDRRQYETEFDTRGEERHSRGERSNQRAVLLGGAEIGGARRVIALDLLRRNMAETV